MTGGMCCKTQELLSDSFPAVTGSNRRSRICVGRNRVTEVAREFVVGRWVPHIFTRKSRLRPGKFFINGCETGRPAGGATDQIRNGDQHENGERTQSLNSATFMMRADQVIE
jgi:hypothetical protein